MRAEERLFLEEGVLHYVDAKDTVAAFESGMCRLVQNVIDVREQWSPLGKKKVGRARPGAGGGEDGRWIALVISGLSPRNEDTEIDCGIWWNAPQKVEPIIYTSFYNKPERLVRFTWKEGQDGINTFEAYNRRFLCVPLPKSLEIEGPINKLLDVLLDKLK